ncbi:MAG: antibiotic biosynthesis monooxygenase [Reichenbachiella sp.]|uniref:antibiotic biosynthesis monooxygenase family protein n=1 Tax=Reichenbachiella sp. TaxID=2184521 RepID=UPI003265922D
MILEVAILNVKLDEGEEFEKAFDEARLIISSRSGYISHDLMKCMEQTDKYILLVKWETIEDHEIGFRQSTEYLEWKRLLHHFYDPFPTVEHYQALN